MITYDKLDEEPVLEGYGQGSENISADEISRLIGYSISPIQLKKRIDSLETQVRIIGAIAIAVIVAKFAKLI